MSGNLYASVGFTTNVVSVEVLLRDSVHINLDGYTFTLLLEPATAAELARQITAILPAGAS